MSSTGSRPKIHSTPFFAVIGSIIDPSSFWATHVPCSTGADEAKNSKLAKLLQIEAKLGEMFNEKQIRIRGMKGMIPDQQLKEGMTVRKQFKIVVIICTLFL